MKPQILISNGSITYIHHCPVIENAIRRIMLAALSYTERDNISALTSNKHITSSILYIIKTNNKIHSNDRDDVTWYISLIEGKIV